MTSAIVFEFVATLIFVIVILGSTQKPAPVGIAGLAIGITLVVIHIFGIHITGVSVNPARSLGPALFVGGKALQQVWLFLVVPSVAGIVAGMPFRHADTGSSGAATTGKGSGSRLTGSRGTHLKPCLVSPLGRQS